MTTGPFDQDPAPPVIPPTHPGGFQVPPRESAWPSAVGIIAIVFGSFAILAGCWGVVTPWFFALLREVLPPGQTVGLEALEEFRTWTVIVSVLTMAVALMALFAGIGLYQRRRWGVQLGLTWAIVKIPFAVAIGVYDYALQRAQFENMSVQGAGGPGLSPGLVAGLSLIGVVLGLLWRWAFPIFLLIWLSRGKIKAETSQWH
jgi:hypothetical protein